MFYFMRSIALFVLLLTIFLPFALKAQDFSKPVDLFIEYCFEANRLNGQAKRPSPDSRWRPVGQGAGSALGVRHDPTAEAYGRKLGQGGEVILRIREKILEEGPINSGEMRHACEIIYSGSVKPEIIHDDFSDYFGAEGFPDRASRQNWAHALPDGWQRWCWADNPERGHNSWRNDDSGCTVVTSPRFYRRHELVQVFLSAEDDREPPLSMLGLYWTFRPDDDARTGKPTVRVEPLERIEPDEKDQKED